MTENISSSSILGRMRRLMPAGIEPRFKSADELMRWHTEQGKIESARVNRNSAASRLKNVLGRSGICELHQSCTFENYRVECDGQRSAMAEAQGYANGFGDGFTSFVFSGGYGTGKNHLAAAIGNQLIERGKSVLVVTIPELMMRIRETYGNSETSEARLMKDLCEVDLLILDEVGVQRENRHEFIVLNQIVDRRLSSLKPVGMLTNLTHREMQTVVGERIMDRLTMDDGLWVNFNWGSYRKNVSHLRIVK